MYLDKKIKKGFSKNMENLKKILGLLKDKLHFFHSGLITFQTTLKKTKRISIQNVPLSNW